MNEDRSHGAGQTSKSIMHDFPVFLATVFTANAVAAALSIGLAGLILDLPIRSLIVPFLVFAYCGIILATLLYLARIFRDRWPTRFPLISGLFMMSYGEIFMMALGFGAVRLRIMTEQEAINYFVAISWLVCIAAFAGGYTGARLITGARQSD